MKNLLSIILCVFVLATANAQSNDITLTAKVFDEIIRTLWTEKPNIKVLRSSALIEKDKAADTYEIEKLWDRQYDTAWVEGVKGPGIGQYFYIEVNNTESINYGVFENKTYRVTVTITNGFSKNIDLFQKNNRVKKAEIRFYDFALRVGQNDMARTTTVVLDKVQTIELADTMEPQTFNFEFTPNKRPKQYKLGQIWREFRCYMKFTILDIYKGSKYDDTCISEVDGVSTLVPYVKGTDVILPPDFDPDDPILYR